MLSVACKDDSLYLPHKGAQGGLIFRGAFIPTTPALYPHFPRWHKPAAITYPDYLMKEDIDIAVMSFSDVYTILFVKRRL